ncbi:MAG TPA: hypothetical protein VFW47_11755 [Phenylobacterium sp.]|nr:hypothetical protein [Phenylobacterium sp.]
MSGTLARRRRPLLPPGSTAWLFAHELRISWRGLVARRGGGMRGLIIVAIAVALFVAFAGVPLGMMLRHFQVPVVRLSVIVADLVLVVGGSLMLSQTLASAAEALYQRGDLDLLFSSPLSPRKTLTVRFLVLALNAFLAFAILISPLLLPVALIGHPPWLAAYVVLASLALTASALGLALAMGLFALIGPRRTRMVAQVSSALIGAGVFLASQAGNLMNGGGGGGRAGLWLQAKRLAADPHFAPPPGADWPLRAMLGEPVPLLVLLAGSLALFFGVSTWLGGRFAADAAAASGADSAVAHRPAGRAKFSSSAFAATLKKELRLLWRDAGLISQVLLRVLYLMPLGLLLIRNAGTADSMVLPGGAGGLAFLAGQVAGSLAWITISAEDAPDLLACAPTPLGTFQTAKLAAAFLPLAALLAPLLAVLVVLSPLTGLAATAGCCAAAVSSGLINIWYQKPSKRGEFRRRRGSSWFALLAEAGVAGLIAVATGIAAAGSPWALVPALIAAGLLFGLRRTDAQIARAIRATD